MLVTLLSDLMLLMKAQRTGDNDQVRSFKTRLVTLIRLRKARDGRCDRLCVCVCVCVRCIRCGAVPAVAVACLYNICVEREKDRGKFRPRQTRQLPRAVDLKGRLLSCQSY